MRVLTIRPTVVHTALCGCDMVGARETAAVSALSGWDRIKKLAEENQN